MGTSLLIQKITDEFSKIRCVFSSNKKDCIVLGTLVVFLVLSIAKFPHWISFVGLFILILKCYSIICRRCSANNELLIKAETENEDLRHKLKDAETENDDLRHKLENAGNELNKSNSLPQNIIYIIEPLQRLENTSLAFGDDYHKIVHEEIERVLRRYKLVFLDYSEDTKDFYDTEEADIDEISYASIAVVKKEHSIDSRESPLILRGKVFIPKNNKK